MQAIVDIQGFKRSSDLFVLKEFAYVEVDQDSEARVIIFKPPVKWKKLLKEEQRTNLWLSENHHGIKWESGWADYDDHRTIIQNNLKGFSKILVKGLDKKKFLREILPPST